MKTKTKFGLSVTLMAAITCFMSLFGGYTPLLLVVGYILICEKDAWLRSIAIGVLLLNLLVSLAGAVIGLIPDALTLVARLANLLFNSGFSFSFLNNFVNLITSFLSFLLKILLLILGIAFLFGQKIKLSALETFVGKYLSHPDKD